MKRIAAVVALLLPLVALAETGVKVKMFPGAAAMPAMAAAGQGLFAHHGLKVELLFTANSDEQRAGLAKGDFEIAQAAVDNAVAMVELAKEDVVIVSGGDSSMNEFIGPPDIRSCADSKGTPPPVHAPTTAYALQLKTSHIGEALKGRDYKITY